jgi:CRISPR/Cas system-associated exonuclease Cas4 (RecB family)
MNNWKEQLESLDGLFTELKQNRQQGSSLRFGRSVIVASDIAEQFYCEKKVEMEYLHGKVETEAKAIGTEAHEKLTEDSVKVKREQLWRDIYGDKPIFALEMFLLAKYGDVLLAGKPDSVLFGRGVPLVLFEYKFSKSDVDYLSYHVQAQTYCVLLDNMGFDTGELSYVIVVADPKTKGSRELRRAVVSTVLKSGLKEAVRSVDGARVYLCKFNRATAKKNLDWALEFWIKSREAETTLNQNKCARCEFKIQCQEPVDQTPSSNSSIC